MRSSIEQQNNVLKAMNYIFTGIGHFGNHCSPVHAVKSSVREYQAQYILELTCSTINFLTNPSQLHLLEKIEYSKPGSIERKNTEQSPTDDKSPF